MRQVFRALRYMHAAGVVHRDMKPTNVLLNRDCEVALADFGLARYMPEDEKLESDAAAASKQQGRNGQLTKYVVTRWYRAPEIMLGYHHYDNSIDMWSMGCIFGEMATGAPLFAGDSEIDTIFKVFQKLGTPSEQMWPGVSELPDFKPNFPQWPTRGWASIRNTAQQVGLQGIDLLENTICYDPKRRLSARRALNHAYFQDVDGSGCLD